jgi:hypothetical protein
MMMMISRVPYCRLVSCDGLSGRWLTTFPRIILSPSSGWRKPEDHCEILWFYVHEYSCHHIVIRLQKCRNKTCILFDLLSHKRSILAILTSYTSILCNTANILHLIWEKGCVVINQWTKLLRRRYKLAKYYFKHTSGIHTPTEYSPILTQDFFYKVASVRYNVYLASESWWILILNVHSNMLTLWYFTDGGKVVSPTRRPLFTPQEDSWYSFLLEAESTPGP